MQRGGTPKQQATAFRKRENRCFLPCFSAPLSLFSCCPTPSPKARPPNIPSLSSPPCACASSARLLPPSCGPLAAPHANAASPCFAALTTLKTSGPPSAPPNPAPSTPPARIPNAREDKNPGEVRRGEAARRPPSPSPNPNSPTSPQASASVTRVRPEFNQAGTAQWWGGAMKSPPAMDPESPPPPPGTPPDDEVRCPELPGVPKAQSCPGGSCSCRRDRGSGVLECPRPSVLSARSCGGCS